MMDRSAVLTRSRLHSSTGSMADELNRAQIGSALGRHPLALAVARAAEDQSPKWDYQPAGMLL